MIVFGANVLARAGSAAVAAVAAGILLVGAPAAAGTLVTRLPDGGYGPGVAKGFEALPQGVVLELADPGQAPQVAEALRARLSGVQVAVEGARVKATGIPAATLLEQLSVLDLDGAGVDPLAELAGLGGGTTMSTPEGGGSIRATNATVDASLLTGHDPAQRVLAEVVEVIRGPFPNVRLGVKVRKAPKGSELRRGKVITADVLLAAGPAGVDFAEVNTQRNLGAFYLTKGDRVALHMITTEDGRAAITYVERVP